jgi:uncharacterized membrane protein
VSSAQLGELSPAGDSLLGPLCPLLHLRTKALAAGSDELDTGPPVFIRVRDSHFRSIVKAVSWRDTGSIDTFVLSFILTGSVRVAGSIAGAEAITKMILYYLHERAWSVILWNQQEQVGGESSST